MFQKVEAWFSSRNICQALEWRGADSCFTSVVKFSWTLSGSEDGLRLRWDAVRGFFVENLFEYLSCLSESLIRLGCWNPGGCAWMCEGGFDCIHPRCPHLHVLLHVLCRYQCASAEDALRYYHAGVQRPLLAKHVKIEVIPHCWVTSSKLKIQP